jgi:hypothetical protein
MFFILSFLFYKIREQEGRISPAHGGGLTLVAREDGGEKG